MKKVSLDVWIQLIGMLSIVASLTFVGLEMRQTQRIAIAGQVQARAQMQVDRLLTGLEGNLNIYRLWDSNNYVYETLTEDEKLIVGVLHEWRGTMLENNFFQYRTGLFDEDYWEQTKNRIQGWYDNCELRPAGQSVLSFQEYLNSLPDNCSQ